MLTRRPKTTTVTPNSTRQSHHPNIKTRTLTASVNLANHIHKQGPRSENNKRQQQQSTNCNKYHWSSEHSYTCCYYDTPIVLNSEQRRENEIKIGASIDLHELVINSVVVGCWTCWALIVQLWTTDALSHEI